MEDQEKGKTAHTPAGDGDGDGWLSSGIEVMAAGRTVPGKCCSCRSGLRWRKRVYTDCSQEYHWKRIISRIARGAHYNE